MEVKEIIWSKGWGVDANTLGHFLNHNVSTQGRIDGWVGKDGAGLHEKAQLH